MTNPNVAVWFELPVTDMERARRFYETVLGKPMVEIPDAPTAEGMEMLMFPGEPGAVCGALVKYEHYRPSKDGAVVYLNGGDDLAPMLARAEAAGASVCVPKTSIAPYGCIALFVDSEGNRVGLHSMN